MASDWDFGFYEQWDESHQRLYDGMADSMGAPEIYNDPVLQGYVEVLFGDDPVRGDDRDSIQDALEAYMLDVYGYDFDDVWDWEAWREAYGAD